MNQEKLILMLQKGIKNEDSSLRYWNKDKDPAQYNYTLGYRNALDNVLTAILFEEFLDVLLDCYKDIKLEEANNEKQ